MEETWTQGALHSVYTEKMETSKKYKLEWQGEQDDLLINTVTARIVDASSFASAKQQSTSAHIFRFILAKNRRTKDFNGQNLMSKHWKMNEGDE